VTRERLAPCDGSRPSQRAARMPPNYIGCVLRESGLRPQVGVAAGSPVCGRRQCCREGFDDGVWEGRHERHLPPCDGQAVACHKASISTANHANHADGTKRRPGLHPKHETRERRTMFEGERVCWMIEDALGHPRGLRDLRLRSLASLPGANGLFSRVFGHQGPLPPGSTVVSGIMMLRRGGPIAAKDNQNLHTAQLRHAAFSRPNTTDPVASTIASAMSPRSRAALVLRRSRRIAPKHRSCRISATAAHTAMSARFAE